MQLFQCLEFFTFEFHFHFQIPESKEVAWTDITAVRRLGSMTESAGLETILTPGRSMRCGSVKMHYRSSRVRILPAVQDMSEQLKHVLAEVCAVTLCLRWEPIDQDGAVDAQYHGEHSFARADRDSHSCADLVG
jgi:hypothetical protein